MGDLLRLVGLTQEGAALPILLACAVVWMTMTVRQLRSDIDKMKLDLKQISDTLNKVSERLHTVSENVAFLLGRESRGTDQ